MHEPQGAGPKARRERGRDSITPLGRGHEEEERGSWWTTMFFLLLRFQSPEV